MDWNWRFGIGIRDSALGLWIGHWGFGLGIGIRDWGWELEIGIEDQDWESGLMIRIRIGNWE